MTSKYRRGDNQIHNATSGSNTDAEADSSTAPHRLVHILHTAQHRAQRTRIDYRQGAAPAAADNLTSSSSDTIASATKSKTATTARAIALGRSPSIVAGRSMSGTPSAGPDGEPNVSAMRVAAALVFFCMSSLGAIFVNKMMLTAYRFSYPSALMLLQSAFTLCLIPTVEWLRPSLVRVMPLRRGEWRKLIVPAFAFVANVTVGLGALSRVNIPMFSAFRRLTVLFVMVAEYIMLRKTHSTQVCGAVLILTAGAFVSALGDVTFSALGYALVFANNALTACYLAAIKRAMRGDNALDPISLLFHLNCLACPAIALLAVASGDLRNAIDAYSTRTDLQQSAFFLPVLAVVSCSAFLVNLSTSVCTHVTSPLTTSVAGQVKNVAQSILGFFSWGYQPTILNVFGLLVALAGQVAFARFKFLETNAAKIAASEVERKPESAMELR